MTAHGMETQPGTFVRAIFGLSEVIWKLIIIFIRALLVSGICEIQKGVLPVRLERYTFGYGGTPAVQNTAAVGLLWYVIPNE